MTRPIAVCTPAASEEETARGVEELLTLGRAAAAAAGAELVWCALGRWPEGFAELAARHGAAAVDRLEHERLEPGAHDAHVEALAQWSAARTPALVLMPQTPDARLVAARVAGRLATAVLTNAVGVEADGGALRVTASAYGGDLRSVYELAGPGPHWLTVTPSAVRAEPAAAASTPRIERVALRLDGAPERVRVVERAKSQGPRLEDARVIVAGGRGLGVPANYPLVEQLAEALGGMAGASRPLVDEGWVDASRQVGLTGRITRPALYVACGISGASQHMAGCAAAKTLVAINRDPDAAIFRYARYGLVADCLEVLPELIRIARTRTQETSR